jgi:hypothetical protein
VPTLVLPTASHADRRLKTVVLNDLEEIQAALRAHPLEKEDAIGKIECSVLAWEEAYKGAPPADLLALMGHLRSLVTRLEGGESSASPGKATPMSSQARPLLEQLEVACKETTDGVARLKADRPKLEKRAAQLEESRAKQLACAQRYDQLASDARRREAEVANLAATYQKHIQAHDDAVATSLKEVDALEKSRDEMATLLANRDVEETNGGAPAGGLPEVQIILSYKPEN